MKTCAGNPLEKLGFKPFPNRSIAEARGPGFLGPAATRCRPLPKIGANLSHEGTNDMRIIYMGAALALASGAMNGLAAPARASTTVYAASTSAKTDLSPTGGVPTTILTLTVPAGSWIFTGTADPVNFGARDFERCGITVGGQTVDMSASMAGTDTAVVNVKTQAALRTSQTHTVTLFCQHDDSTAGEYVDADAWLIAQPVGGIGIQ